MLFFQIFLPSTTPAKSFLSLCAINSTLSRFLAPCKKSRPSAQIGVFTKILVASLECSKYVTTAILMLSATLESVS